MSVLNNATNANPTTSYYALAGESAKNWYKFPSENGEILLVDASGTQMIHSIDANLYYNNELIAKQGDIQNVADWSLFPALATVELANQNITQVGDISGSTAHIGTITTSTVNATGITGGTITSTGLLTAGSVSSTGNIQGASLTTTGGLDMTNSAITRASAVNLSAAGAAPYGALSSPDGVMLTWRGAEVKTGAAGNVAQWATFPAVQDVGLAGYNLNNASTVSASAVTATTGNIGTMTMTGNLIQGGSAATTTIAAGANQNTILAAPSGGVTVNSYNSIDNNAGVAFNVTVDRGINPAANAGIRLNAKNGAGGRIDIIADEAEITPSPGIINMTANGGNITIDGNTFSVGGLINIDANSGSLSPYSLTSAVKVSAAGINLYAGGIPSVGSLAGYLFQYANLGVNICAGLPSVIPNIPTTVYIFGLGGVRIEGYAGIQMLSDTYIGNLYPLSGSDLILQGRSLPNGYVKVRDCNEFTMTSGGAAQINTITGVGGGSNPTTIDNIKSNNISADSSNLTITGKVNTLVADYLVEIQKADTIAFDAAGAGAITGLQTINGAPYVASDTNQWATYPAVQNVDISGFDLTNVNQINGAPYPPPAGDVSTWATFPAVQNVDISGFAVTNVNNIAFLDNGYIVSAGSLGIFSDLSGDLSIAAAGGGNVNIGNGGLGNINIVAVDQTTTVSGKIVNITGVEGTTLTDPSGVTIIAPFLDLRGADLVDVKNINGDAGVAVTVNSSLDIGLQAANDVYIEAQAGTAYLNGATAVNISSSAGAVTLNSTTEVAIPTSQLNMTNNKIVNLAAGTVSGDAVNYGQLTFRDSTEFWVSAQGNDANNGSILSPKLTIQAAITAAELISSAANICVINVASGHYTETLTFNKGYVVLNGSLQTQTGNEVCEITGSINIACVGANDVFNRQVTFQGFNLTMIGGQTITNTSSSSHTVAFQDCKCFADNIFYTSSASAPDMRTYFTNMEITSVSALNTATVISTNVGLVEFERVDLTVNGNAIGIAIGGTSVLNRCSLSTLDNTNTAVILKPLINITSSTTAAHSLGNVAFAFTSAVAKTNTNAMAIASSINTAIIMLNCVFTLAGTANSTNYCVGYNGVGSPTIAGVNNTSLSVNVLLPQTTTVQSGIAQVSYIDINPPGLASYSSSVDQTIAVANTPQALTFNTTQINSGTTLVANSRVYVTAQGNYALNYIVQLSNSSGASHLATTFLKKNGGIIANTGSQWTLDNAHELSIAKENIVALNAGDYVEVFFNADALGVLANATAATVALPAIPSVVFNIKQFR